MASITAKTLIERLQGADNAQRSQFIELAIDHTLNLPVRTLLDVDAIAAVITDALTDANTEKLIQEELDPLLKRLHGHFEGTEETPRDLLPEGTPEKLIKIVAKGDRPRAAWAKGSVDLAPIRGLIAPIFQDVLLNFTKSLPIPGLGGDSGQSSSTSSTSSSKSSRSRGRLGKALRKRAGSIADMSKGVIGGLSGELERKIQATTRDFSNQALGEIRGAIRERLKSKEGQDVIRQTRISLTERFLDTPVHILLEDVYRLPIEDLAGLLPPISEHNRPRPQLRAFIEAEVAYHLNTQGDKTLGEFLEEYHLRDTLRAQVIAQLDAPVASFIESEGFADWLQNLLDG